MTRTAFWPASAVSVLTACCVLTGPLLAEQANSNRETRAALSGSWVFANSVTRHSGGPTAAAQPAAEETALAEAVHRPGLAAADSAARRAAVLSQTVPTPRR